MDETRLKAIFSAPDFHPNQFASNAVFTNEVPEVLRSVNETIRRLDASIFEHVASHHKDLLKRATEIDGLHEVLQLTEGRISMLSQSMENLKKRISGPYAQLQTHIRQFRNLQVTSTVLRQIARADLLIKRITSRSTDMFKLSSYIDELEYLFSVVEWEGVHVLESYKRLLDQSREDMNTQAWGLVDSSFELADQVQLGLGLQVFRHLGILPNVVCDLVKRWQDDFTTVLTVALDVDTLNQRVRTRQQTVAVPTCPGRVCGSGIGGQAAAFYVAMWTSLDGLMDKLDRLSSHFRLLALTLLKKHEASSTSVDVTPVVRLDPSIAPNPSLAELLLHDILVGWHHTERVIQRTSIVLLFASVNLTSLNSVAERDFISVDAAATEVQANIAHLESQLRSSEGFVGWAFDRLATMLSKIADQSPQVRDVLEGEYPKLLKLVLDLERRIRQAHMSSAITGMTEHSDTSRQSTPSSATDLPAYMTRALGPFETAYLSRSLSRLLDQVNMAFSATTTAPLDSGEIDNIVQSAVSELAYGTVHYDLLCKVASNVSKILPLFANKVEMLISVGPAACQVMDVQTSSQENNLHLINMLCMFGRQLDFTCSRRLRNLPVLLSQSEPSFPLQVIRNKVAKHLDVLCVHILQPLLESVGENVQRLLSAMHTDNFASSYKGDPNAPDNPQTSLNYMKQLQEFIGRVRRTYFSGLSQPPPSLPVATLYGKRGTSSTATAPGYSSNFICGEMALQHTLRLFLTQWTDMFLHNISLVRPVSEHSRLRLATDCAEFELAVAPLFSPALGTSLESQAPEAYARLKAFRPVLLAETEHIVTVFTGNYEQTTTPDLNTTVVPPSLVCQHLFSRAPDEIRSPHDSAGWSIAQYISWTLARSVESERLTFLRNALAAYVNEVQLRQQREYPPEYVLLRTFLQQCTSHDGVTETTPTSTSKSTKPVVMPCASAPRIVTTS